MLLCAPRDDLAAQSIKPLIDGLGQPASTFERLLQDRWSALSPDEWGNKRFIGPVFGQRLELTLHVADDLLLQLELRILPTGDDVIGTGNTYRILEDSLDAIYGQHTGTYSPLTWSVVREDGRTDTLQIRSTLRAFISQAAVRLATTRIARSGLDWSCVQRRTGGLDRLPRNQQAYYDALLGYVSALRARGAASEMLRRASCGTIQVGDFREAVVLAYGLPESATESQSSLGLLEIWYYDGMRTVVTTLNGRVTDITRHR